MDGLSDLPGSSHWTDAEVEEHYAWNEFETVGEFNSFTSDKSPAELESDMEWDCMDDLENVELPDVDCNISPAEESAIEESQSKIEIQNKRTNSAGGDRKLPKKLSKCGEGKKGRPRKKATKERLPLAQRKFQINERQRQRRQKCAVDAKLNIPKTDVVVAAEVSKVGKRKKYKARKKTNKSKDQRKLEDRERQQRHRRSIHNTYLNIAKTDYVTAATITGNNVQHDTLDPNYGRHVFAQMNIQCRHCSALLWKEENCGTKAIPQSMMCCNNGEVNIPNVGKHPEPLRGLLENDTAQAKEFRKNIRAYNSALSFTSVGVALDAQMASGGRGVFTYRIHGEMYHLMGSLLPLEGNQPKFAQIYVHDTDNELKYRMNLMPNLVENTMRELQIMLHKCNPYVKIFKQALTAEQGKDRGAKTISMVIRGDIAGKDGRRYNAPSGSEIAVLMPGDGMENTTTRDIVVLKQSGQLHRISELNANYDPLHYVLLFPTGDQGWNESLRNASGKRKITLKQFYSFRLQVRANNLSLHRCGRLFHQYVVDAYAKIENSRLSYIRQNQREIRGEMVQGIQDALEAGDTSAAKTGRNIILPSSFIGGPRHMFQLFQDAMSIVREFGKPDLFVTFTCNPQWPEISMELLAGQVASDRPDLCSRVFNLKLKAFTDDLFKFAVLGRVIAHIHVIEFQKRGLPHAHFLIILASEDKPRDALDYDGIVSAELPDQTSQKQAYDTVTQCMIHGPCGKLNPKCVCMKEDKCSKGYPKEFVQSTQAAEDGYPLYRRRDDGRYVMVKGLKLDNRWVVPHNVYLVTKYNAHINVEICSTVKAVKYLYKYVYKGHDRAVIEFEKTGANNESTTSNATSKPVDEIKNFLDVRYVSASECCWRIFGFRMHEEYPAVNRLAVHLENQQQLYFKPTDDLSEVLESKNTTTTLLAWFEANKKFPEANEHFYHKFPIAFVWRNDKKEWKQRERNFTGVIGRLATVQPSEGERYYLRLLLHHVKGATSFEDMKTVNGVSYDTFKKAAIERGLLQDDNEWDLCLEEGELLHNSSRLRALFVCLLVYCEVSEPRKLFDRHFQHFGDDFKRNKKLKHMSDVAVFRNHILLDIHTRLQGLGKSLSDYIGFPDPQQLKQSNPKDVPMLIEEELSYDCDALTYETAQRILKLNPGQRKAYDTINKRLQSDQGGTFFIDGPGGTGKTFVYNTLLASIRAKGEIALAVASSGIAATLLDGGRTAHSRFKIPINVKEDSTCSISVQTSLAQLIRKTKLIVWDEAPMSHKHIFQAVDRTIRDIMKTEDPAKESIPFGGKVVVFGGDFRQILPVIKHGSRGDIVAACLKNSSLWDNIEKLKLSENMRIRQACGNNKLSLVSFNEFLMNMGDGKLPIVQNDIFDDIVEISAEFCLPKTATIHDLIDEIFPKAVGKKTRDVGISSVILTVKNEDVNLINDSIIQRLKGAKTTYCSCDTVDNREHEAWYPTEFLNSLQLPGYPPHKLILQEGVPIILLRNLHPSKGLCNGTRLICKQLLPHLIEAKILTGKHKDSIVYIPRITFLTSETEFPFQLRRKQFPVQPCFAITVNKGQGQTFDKIGLYLPSPVFTHGQLYVAFSRVGSPNNVRVLIKNNHETKDICATRNVVYKEILGKIF